MGLTHPQVNTNPVKVVVLEESARVSDISATGSIRRRRQQLECFQAFDFRVRAFVLRGNFGDVAIDELMKCGAFSLDPRDEDAPVDFAFDHACPGLGSGLGFEGFALAG